MKSLLTVCCMLPFILFSQDEPRFATSLIPPGLLKNANAVIREHEIEFTVKSLSMAVLKERRVATVFNDDSSYDQLAIYYDSFHKLGKLKGVIYDKNGQFVREIEKSEIRDESAISGYSIYEDNRVRGLDVNHDEYPYTIAFEYDLTFVELMNYPDWNVATFSTAVQHSRYILDLPKSLEVETKLLNLDISPVEESIIDRRRITWDVSDLQAVAYEPFGPPIYEMLPAMLVSPHLFQARNYQGSMASWERFGHFMNRLMDGRDELSPEMKMTVQSLTKEASTDEAKIHRLYRYLQENMRYVSVQLGIGGWQPFPATYVEERKYGDCKALSNFMKAMLKEVEIQSWPVLIQSGDLYYEITDDFAIPAFNHMILYVPASGYWLECTSHTDPPGYLGPSVQGRNVILLTEDGGKLARTPDQSAEKNQTRNNIRIRLSVEGSAEVVMESLLSGSKQEWVRFAAEELSLADQMDYYRRTTSLSGFDYEKLEFHVDAGKPETRVEFSARVPRFASKAGRRLFIPLNACNQFSEVPQADEERIHPVVSRNAYRESDHITLKIPDGYQVESMPSDGFFLESPYGRYSIKATQVEQAVIIERELEILPVQLPPEEYVEWRNFYKQIYKADNGKLVLVEKKT